MKKTIIFLMLIVSIFLFNACASSPSGIYVDEIFEEENVEAIIQYHGKETIAAHIINFIYENEIPFIVSGDDGRYDICRKCKIIYKVTADGETDEYCLSCAEKYYLGDGCSLCGAWRHDFDELVKFHVNEQLYYMCADCATKYFVDIQPMKPCYYCIHCGRLTDSKKYIHSWSDEVLCERCVSLYSKCTSCGEYDTELRNNICGMCGNF